MAAGSPQGDEPEAPRPHDLVDARNATHRTLQGEGAALTVKGRSTQQLGNAPRPACGTEPIPTGETEPKPAGGTAPTPPSGTEATLGLGTAPRGTAPNNHEMTHGQTAPHTVSSHAGAPGWPGFATPYW